jgi:hypothetical protein
MSDVTQFTQVNRGMAKNVRNILDKELSSILEPYGLNFELGNCTYDPDEGWLKFREVRLAVALNGERPLTAKQQALQNELDRRKGGPHELDPNYPGATVTGERCKLVGYKPRATKRPFVIEMLESGKTYVVDVNTVNREFRITPIV